MVSRTLYRYVDWNKWFITICNNALCRTLYRYVDWNQEGLEGMQKKISRTLYRYVDWNLLKYFEGWGTFVVPYIGTWIETFNVTDLIKNTCVVPYIGTWIETAVWRAEVPSIFSRTLYRYVDWNDM